MGRAEELAALRQSLRLQDVCGAVLVGAPGLGKTSLLQAVQDSSPHEYFLRVRGARATASAPYRALNFLLSRLPADLTSPPLLPTALTAYLRKRAGGRPLVFAVDNGELLDAASATLIGQLVANGTARLVMAVRDFARLDPVFSALWRGSRLIRLDVAPLDVAETRHLLEAELGAPVSREALEEVRDAAHGNPQAILETLQGLVDAGALARRGPAWVLLGNVPAPSAPGAAPSAVLAPSECEVLKLLALAGPSPWAHLIRLVAARDLDALQGRGLITVTLQQQPVFSVAAPRRVRALVAATSRAEAAALHSRYTAVSGAARSLEADPVRRTVWALKAGLPVGEEQLVAAVSALNAEGRYAHAAELVDAGRGAGDAPTPPRLALQGAVAALGSGRHRTAEILGLSLATVTEQPDVELWVRCRIQLSRIQRSLSTANAAEYLDAAMTRLIELRYTADAEAVPGLARLARLIGTEQAELAAFEGRFHENLLTAPALLAEESGESGDPEVRVTLQSLLLEAHALVDQRPAEPEFLRSLAAGLSSREVSSPVADAALQRVDLAARLTGDRSHEEYLGGIPGAPERWSVRRGSQAELAEALTLLAQDRPRDAVRLLGPVVEQLRELDPHGFLPAAAAALTYCHAQLESRNSMIAHLPLSDAGAGRSWSVRRAARHYQLLSITREESRAESARRLQECAAEDLALGATSWALVALTAAVRLGRVDALEELRRVAGSLHGPLAGTSGLYATALLGNDRELLVEAIGQAVAAGSYRFAMDIAQSGIVAATRAQDRAGVRYLQRRLKQLLPEGIGRAEAYESFEALTAREREIALLTFAGHSNKVIAEQLFVSVRTIEGHLYQVYTKLNVSTRAELAECIPPGCTP
ncbi:helix-turn-helix transcriptional regulator [Arthrobacter sp. RIT-PI-e]|uniref:helix-turn-helix transcriptional regulator n=1 Tax=Arthrobacter sp. RIT-PI-e TaxID=1681197 RepID=UPI000676473E|nr:LuxR C-terminal-related transcriptional regulator [Arthrobacter sp. RIT-PI-e]